VYALQVCHKDPVNRDITLKYSFRGLLFRFIC